ncbi:jg26671, partial [Pararge aegeria aegeria]
SLVARDSKGNLMAGIYFVSKRKETKLTVSYVGPDNVKLRKKLNLEDFLDLSKIPRDIIQDVELCNEQLHMEDGTLTTLLHELAVVMNNCSFVSEMHDLNDMMKNLTIKMK